MRRGRKAKNARKLRAGKPKNMISKTVVNPTMISKE